MSVIIIVFLQEHHRNWYISWFCDQDSAHFATFTEKIQI
jgi:hypothetical protein